MITQNHYYIVGSFLVKKIMYILLAKKRKIDTQCVCVLHSVTVFWKCPLSHKLDGGGGFIDVSCTQEQLHSSRKVENHCPRWFWLQLEYEIHVVLNGSFSNEIWKPASFPFLCSLQKEDLRADNKENCRELWCDLGQISSVVRSCTYAHRKLCQAKSGMEIWQLYGCFE